MYDHPYLLYLYAEMRQKELLEKAERAKLIKLARNNRPGNQGLGARIVKWARVKSFENNQGGENPREQLRMAGQCCTKAES